LEIGEIRKIVITGVPNVERAAAVSHESGKTLSTSDQGGVRMHENRIRTLTEKKLYSIDEVLETTGLGRTKLFELLANGSVASVRVGTRRLIPVSALDSWIEGLRNEEANIGSV
jgi:excisionase family DNA binding protein